MGIEDIEKIARIRNTVKSYIDKFCNDYLAANPKGLPVNQPKEQQKESAKIDLNDVDLEQFDRLIEKKQAEYNKTHNLGKDLAAERMFTSAEIATAIRDVFQWAKEQNISCESIEFLLWGIWGPVPNEPQFGFK
ncbi:MAG: hypothetical protein JXB29_04490 [Sedimentisphaerales bacterium]|nr:hypothetical protein [Sedimentisphaerales bacterium]